MCIEAGKPNATWNPALLLEKSGQLIACAECGIDFYATPPGDSEGAEVTEPTDTYCKRVAVNPATIARITEVSASSQRHRARSLIHPLDGTFLEVNEGCDRILVKPAKMGAL